jgi:hypothetical protein
MGISTVADRKKSVTEKKPGHYRPGRSGKCRSIVPVSVPGKTGTRIKRILPDEYGIACEAKRGSIHANAWAGKKVKPLFQAWGLVVFFSFKRFQRDENRIYHVEIP